MEKNKDWKELFLQKEELFKAAESEVSRLMVIEKGYHSLMAKVKTAEVETKRLTNALQTIRDSEGMINPWAYSADVLEGE